MHTSISRNSAPGTVVSVRVGPFLHVGIVSDRTGPDGFPMVISSSRRRGRAVEESWQEFAGDERVSVRERHSGPEGQQIVARARRMLGTPWDPVFSNCEHFVERACGRAPRSGQLQAVGSVAAMFALVLLFARE